MLFALHYHIFEKIKINVSFITLQKVIKNLKHMLVSIY